MKYMKPKFETALKTEIWLKTQIKYKQQISTEEWDKIYESLYDYREVTLHREAILDKVNRYRQFKEPLMFAFGFLASLWLGSFIQNQPNLNIALLSLIPSIPLAILEFRIKRELKIDKVMNGKFKDIDLSMEELNTMLEDIRNNK